MFWHFTLIWKTLENSKDAKRDAFRDKVMTVLGMFVVSCSERFAWFQNIYKIWKPFIFAEYSVRRWTCATRWREARSWRWRRPAISNWNWNSNQAGTGDENQNEIEDGTRTEPEEEEEDSGGWRRIWREYLRSTRRFSPLGFLMVLCTYGLSL